MDEARMMEVFMDVQRGLPRQGPGCDDSTRQAVSYCRDLSAQPEVLDIGCGPGQQTLVLADALDAQVTAVDFHQEYLDELESRSEAAGVREKVRTMLGDMNDLPFEAGRFDLVWAEGSAYIMGVAEALRAWKSLLGASGYLALTELVWLSENPPSEPAEFFAQEYPAMSTVDANLAMFTDAGYRVVGHFTIPDRAWWDGYYEPLAAKLPKLREKYSGDEGALEVVQMTETEIGVRKEHGDSYGYEFFVAQPIVEEAP